MSYEFSTTICDKKQFEELALSIPEIKLFKRTLQGRISDKKRTIRDEIKASLKSRFPYLTNALYPKLSRLNFFNIDPLDQDCFIAVTARDNQSNLLVGFAHIEHFSAKSMGSDALNEAAERVGDTGLERLGYDCVTTLSVDEDWRGNRLSGLLLRGAAEAVKSRHLSRGGSLPAVLALSSFEPMGRERLLRETYRLASEECDILVRFGMMDQHELGNFVVREENTCMKF